MSNRSLNIIRNEPLGDEEVEEILNPTRPVCDLDVEKYKKELISIPIIKKIERIHFDPVEKKWFLESN
jgi:hypothetical protein